MKRGFTLIEFMVIASILAITGAIVLHFIALKRVQPTRHNLEATRQALDQYKAQNGSYPDSLDALVEKKLLPAESTKDQWGNLIVYRLSAGVAQLSSSGPDGAPESRDDIHPDND